MGYAGDWDGISDTGGSLTFSGFVSGEMEICLSFVRFRVMGLIKHLITTLLQKICDINCRAQALHFQLARW